MSPLESPPLGSAVLDGSLSSVSVSISSEPSMPSSSPSTSTLESPPLGSAVLDLPESTSESGSSEP